ncbi:carbohydrate-binding protein [Streptomyces sioyaensis]|uniref:Carbohydrate-binding protein n=1 Tax=Streptomyces sioyaensis TaxID=67364 RepID=A0A4Q1QTG8_9ACTN|nr:carbohydrate-binding protein [Streptomyces sioyaensis]MBM4794130.1 carbohydrate-binding protein [Streptomyces sioyaensis]RXS60762.1 carbohydrate-binding protein [Streptomyces sioyaensis]
MTAGNNGADTPENDDPFGYLYRSEGGEGGTPGSAGTGAPTRQPGIPRTSYNQVRAVGERQYGQQPQQPTTYGQQNAHYAAPETLPGGDRTRSAPAPDGPEPRRNRNGLLIGAVSVVAVVCIGIGVAMLNNGNESKANEAGKQGSAAGGSVKPNGKKTDRPKPGELPKEEAGSLRLDGGASVAKDVPGARSANGTYVAGMNTPGAAATWTLNVDQAGKYKLWVGYGVPGKDANLTMAVNDKPDGRPVNMENFAHAPEGAWDKGWTKTWSYVQLNKGSNTIKLSCETGNQCDVNLDKVWLARP